jgi:hypothetical protein
MDDPHFYADVDLPFHVWVREGPRWVLRNAADRLKGEPARRGRRERDSGDHEDRRGAD